MARDDRISARRTVSRGRVKEIACRESLVRRVPAEERVIDWRKKHGKENCPRNLGGYDSDNDECEVCRDASICEEDTPKQLQSTAYHLGKLGYEYDEELWVGIPTRLHDPDFFNINEERGKIVEFALSLDVLIEEDPILISKIKALPVITNKFLNQHVPGWSKFKREVMSMKPRLKPEQALSRLAQIWNNFADMVKKETDIENPHEALAEILDNYSAAKTREKILSSIGNQLTDYLEAFHNTFTVKKENKPLWPKAWMENDKKGIKVMIEKRTHFIPLMNYLCSCQLGSQDAEDLIQRRGIEPYQAEMNTDGKKWTVNRTYVLLQKLNFEKMEEVIGLKSDPLRKHLQELERIGVLKNLGKDGPRGQLIYALGYWLPVPNKPFPRPVYFLKDTPQMKIALRDFNPYREKSIIVKIID